MGLWPFGLGPWALHDVQAILLCDTLGLVAVRVSPKHATARRRLACAVLSSSSSMSPRLITSAVMAITRRPRASRAGCAPNCFGVASPYTVSIARLRITLEALNPTRITACRYDGPDNIVAKPRVRRLVAEISRASAR